MLRLLGGLLGLVLSPGAALAADAETIDLPFWSAAPFVILLLAIAILPLFFEHFWHRNRSKALVAGLLAAPVAGYLLALSPQTGGESTRALLHALEEYASFIILLGALYVVSGGLVLLGDIRGTPWTNAGFLTLGAVLANLIGTTGASMVLIRPVLRINQQRRHVGHIPVFFIFMVANLGGLLTPLGDPPLFLGFLHGVEFFWTASLWPQWLAANGIVLVVFLIWETIAYNRETAYAIRRDIAQIEPIRVRGLINIIFLAGILIAVLFQSESVAKTVQGSLSQLFPCPSLQLHKPWGEVMMLVMSVASLLFTPRGLRAANRFSWHPIIEVAVLFAGIFVTMVPALEILKVRGPELGVREPWQYFWLTGILSSLLDNAPTYLSFATMAAGSTDFSLLAKDSPLILAAISCGAVFMGANTYIGNGPNFMVKAIADQTGIRAPSFLGYMVYSGLILLPIFVVITIVFFPPG